jgi:hypothetical protein
MDRREIGGIAAAVAFVLGGIGYLLHRAALPPEPMEPGQFTRLVRQLASDAREAERLAGLVATAQVNEHYAKAHHKKLAQDVHDAKDEFDHPPPQGGEAEAKRAVELATRMQQLLEGAGPQLADRDAMQRLHDEHARIAAELGRLAGK